MESPMLVARLELLRIGWRLLVAAITLAVLQGGGWANGSAQDPLSATISLPADMSGKTSERRSDPVSDAGSESRSDVVADAGFHGAR